MTSFYDHVEIEDFDFDADADMYYYPCPCGDRFQISKVRQGEGIRAFTRLVHVGGVDGR